ncbi:MAG: diaminopimelate decarboxylase [Phycisphaeraceae bacterium]|nr:diaminopimelate decarboxylase [Bacteroidota bacterium]MCW5768116.1 diaminopimelate decarboxylase [Phycisphaeraceae bacterium]
MTSFRYLNHELYCEDARLSELIAEFGSPLYVYSRRAIVENCRAIEAAFEGYLHRTTYAVKANANVYLLKLIAEQGLGADVGSKGELFIALNAGFPPDSISFSGVGKRDDEIAYALEEDIYAFNVESKQELEVISTIASRLGKTARILLRLNLDIDAGTHAYISTGQKHNKFGISSRKAVEILGWAQHLPSVEIRGVHSHIGSQILSQRAFVEAAHALERVVGELRNNNIAVHEVDFGGGFGIRYHGVLTHPRLPAEKMESETLSAAEFLKTVLPILRKTECTITIQPGRSIVGDAGVLVTTVLYRKEQEGKNFVVIDGGMNDLIRPSLYQAHHQIVPLQLSNTIIEEVDVVGPCCESGDFFAQDRLLPLVSRGDVLAVLCAGAYGYVLSSNYNSRLRPAEVLVNGSQATSIRSRENLEDLLS